MAPGSPLKTQRRPRLPAGISSVRRVVISASVVVVRCQFQGSAVPPVMVMVRAIHCHAVADNIVAHPPVE
jgi:hypothetical protein